MLHLFLGRKERGRSFVRSIVLSLPLPGPSIEGYYTKAVETRPIRLADSSGRKTVYAAAMYFYSQRFPHPELRGDFFPCPAALSDASPVTPPSERKAKTASQSRADTTYSPSPPPRRATTTKTRRAGKLGRGLSRRHISRKKKRGTQERGGEGGEIEIALPSSTLSLYAAAAALLPLHGLRQRRRGRDRRESGLPAGPLPLVDDVFGGGGGRGVGVARRVISDAWDAPLSLSLSLSYARKRLIYSPFQWRANIESSWQ